MVPGLLVLVLVLVEGLGLWWLSAVFLVLLGQWRWLVEWWLERLF